MALRNVELYEALKPSIGEDAARMIAEVVPPAADLATKHDLVELRGDLRAEIVELRGEMREGFAALRAEMNAGQANSMRWMLGFFIPVWAGTWATVVAILLKL